MDETLHRELINLSKIAPLSGYIDSSDFRVKELQEKHNVSRCYMVEVLQYLEEKYLIRELYVNYDVTDKHILSYRFK